MLLQSLDYDVTFKNYHWISFSLRTMSSYLYVLSWISCTYMVILSPWITQKSFAIQEALIQDETDRHYDEALVYIDVYNFIANLDFKNVKANKYVRSLFFKKSFSHVKKKIYNSNMSCILAPNALNSKVLQPWFKQ